MNVYKCDGCGKIFDSDDHSTNCYCWYGPTKYIEMNVDDVHVSDTEIAMSARHYCSECDCKISAFKRALKNDRVKLTKKNNLKIKKKDK